VLVGRALGIKPTEESTIINPNGSLRDVVISIRNAPAGSNPLDGPREVHQQGCVYVPHVVSVSTGQTFKIENGDAISHNINFASENNGSFNEGQPQKGMVKEVKFAKPEMGARLKCDVHTWMNTFVYIFDNPFHAVSNEQGVYKIAGLPPGEYEVVFTHPELGEKTQKVTVSGGSSARTDVEFGR
jgi:plastocyanin